MSTDSEVAAACYNHPDVTRHVQDCRWCKRMVCQECRVSQYVGGGGIPALCCLECKATQERAAARKKGVTALGALVLVALVLGVLVTPWAFALMALVSLGFAWISWQRIRSGMGTPWDVLNLTWIVRRFLP